MAHRLNFANTNTGRSAYVERSRVAITLVCRGPGIRDREAVLAPDEAEEAAEAAREWINGTPSNVEFLARIMEHAKTGPLMQAVVMHALAYYVGKAAQMPAEKFDSAGLSGKAWLECVHELEAALNERLGS